MFKEVSTVIYDKDTVSKTIGLFGSVDFDFETIWAYVKNLSCFISDDLHFIHTHPLLFDTFSEIDVRCMKSLNIAFGFPINFWIVFQTAVSYSAVCYRYVDDDVVVCHEYVKLSDFIIRKALT